ncbi:MAG: AAC(3) family N-acetyltransferase [Ruminococcus sp.]|nr:AAC(3) family N-acetyltransferase [Ruminococcus sp.]MCC8174070.1 AAC(3) family N-acetyltransferase [Odoribacter sp.]
MTIKNTLKKLLGLRKNQRLNYFDLRSNLSLKYGPIFYKKKFSTEDFIESLTKLGIKPGDNVFIHSSWDQFYNYDSSPEELIKAIITYLGTDSTIAMPSYPLLKKNKIFNISKTVTKGGIIAETFRKLPGVKRSPNIQHSVAALGPLSNEILSDHVNSEICYDEHSPYFKITEHGFKILSLGLTSFFIGTIIHVPSGVMYKNNKYFNSFFDLTEKKRFKYIDYDGIEKEYSNYQMANSCVRRVSYFKNKKIVKQYFPKNIYKNIKLSNLTISVYDARETLNILCTLAEKNIYIYTSPKP